MESTKKNSVKEKAPFAQRYPITNFMIGLALLVILGREKRIPFEVAVDPFYSKENMNRLKESVAQMEAAGGTVHEVGFDD